MHWYEHEKGTTWRLPTGIYIWPTIDGQNMKKPKSIILGLDETFVPLFAPLFYKTRSFISNHNFDLVQFFFSFLSPPSLPPSQLFSSLWFDEGGEGWCSEARFFFLYFTFSLRSFRLLWWMYSTKGTIKMGGCYLLLQARGYLKNNDAIFICYLYLH